jgi:hypothetical protein
MSNRQRKAPESLPEPNYSLAIAQAIAWLGDRYLLAKSVNAKLSYVRARHGAGAQSASQRLEHKKAIGSGNSG